MVNERIEMLRQLVLAVACEETHSALIDTTADTASEAVLTNAGRLLWSLVDESPPSNPDSQLKADLATKLKTRTRMEPSPSEVTEQASALLDVLLRAWLTVLHRYLRKQDQVQLDVNLFPVHAEPGWSDTMTPVIQPFAVKTEGAARIMGAVRQGLFTKDNRASLPLGIELHFDRTSAGGPVQVVARRGRDFRNRK